jgi:S1-C subfamily serine protease
MSDDGREFAATPKLMRLERDTPSANLGVSLVGGNKVGIFVHSVHVDSPAAKAGLR